MDEAKFIKSLDIRKAILRDSLLLENLISIFCTLLLGIERQSSCFGNSSKALSFNQKINLLIDIQAMENIEKNKFIKFMEIRNQFIHNLEAVDFQSCFNFIDGAEKFLLKQYPPERTDIDKETILFQCYHKMFVDISASTKRLLEMCEKKVKDKGVI